MAYWLLTLVLVALGVLTGFSIGGFVLLFAFAMLVLGPFRHRPMIYWPPMVGTAAFIVGYLAIAPFYCEARGTIGSVTQTACSSLIGVRYEGSGAYNPSPMPAALIGAMLGVIAAMVALGAMWWWRNGQADR
ncbi:MAG TPA: hypothetical protein VFN76_05715 [Candidatus Limnocylindria bacterium]|nr:hypothetical protein [Candidatus Limnocylindria bacterium]